MRHRVKTRKLHRGVDARNALIYSLIKASFENVSIKTHEAKAKYVKRFIEKIVSIAKRNKDDLSKRRLLLSKLRNNKDLVDIVIKKSIIYKDINGGFLRIQSCTKRSGDNSKMVNLSWVEIKKEQKDVTPEVETKEIRPKKISKDIKTKVKVNDKKTVK